MPKKVDVYRNYPLIIKPIMVNGREIVEIIISSHYEKNHSTYMKDEVILELVKMLDGKFFPVEDKKSNPNREFFMLDNILYENKFYRLVWCL
jgi:hypothetical protein